MPIITVNSSQVGDITTPEAVIQYDVTLVAGVTYTFRAVGDGTDPYTLGDPYIQSVIRTSNSAHVGFNNDGLIAGPFGRDAMFTYKVPTGAGGTYRIEVTGDLRTTGSFLFSVTENTVGTDTVPANTTTTQVLAVGEDPITGTIDSASDVDWYRVALVAGTTYTFRLRGLTAGGGSLPDPTIAGLYNSSGTYIPNTYVDDIDTRDPSLTISAPYTGNYYIATDGWSTYIGSYSLNVAAVGNDIPSSTATTTTLAVGGTATVLIEQPYDHDWYAVTLTANSTYKITLSGAGYNNTPGLHGILNAAGDYVVSYASPVLGPSSAAASTIFTPTQTGTYYIDTYSLYEGTYTLELTQTADDIPASTASVATVAVNGAVFSDIGGATDLDWYRVSLTANTTYSIRMQGRQSNNGTLDDPIIAGVYNASGVLIANTFADDTDGNEAALVFRPTASDVYYIAADGYSGYTGTYKLSVTEIPVDVGQTALTAGSTFTNTPTLVTIEDTADVDWYGVDLVANTTYTVRLQGAHTKRGTLYDPVLVGVYDSNENLIADSFVDDVGELRNARYTFTPTTSGRYYIAADGYDRFTGTMKLAVTTDYIGTTNATSRALTIGVAEEGTIDFASDVDYYRVSLNPSTTYYFRMLGFYSRNGDLADPNIGGIYTSAGAAVTVGVTTQTDTTGIGNEAWIKFVTPAGSVTDYYLSVNGNGGDGSFLLLANTDVPASASSLATIGSVPGSYIGYIDEASDADWIGVTLNTNTSYLVKMRGFDSSNGTLLDPYINGIRHAATPTTVITGTSVNNVDTRDSLVRINPATAGLHFINAQANGTGIGTYLLSIETEPGDTALSSWTLPVFGSVTGTVDDSTDVDWYSMQLNTNISYLIRMRGVDGGKGTLDNPYLNGLRTSATPGTVIAGTNGTAVDNAVLRDSVIRYIPTSAGTFYVAAQSSSGTLGTYLLSIEQEVGNTFATASTLTTSSPVLGSIDDNTDTDYYKIALNNTSSYLFKMIVTGGAGTLRDSNITLRNSSDAAMTAAGTHSSTANFTYRYAPSSPGDYYVEARGSGSNNGTFRLTAEIEAGSSVTTALSIAPGQTIDAAIDDNADTDYYRINVVNGTSYVFKMLVTGGTGTLSDTNLYLRNGSDQLQTAAGSRNATADFSYRWLATSDGTYYIDARGTGSNNGTYRLVANTEAGGTAASAGSIAVGDTVNAMIDDNTDIDYYRISVSNTSAYVIKMLVTGGAGTLSDTVLAVRNGADVAQTMASSLSTGADFIVRWAPSTPGDYFIDARGTGTNSGTYRLVVTYEPGATPASAGSIAVGETLENAIEDNTDIDYYRISLLDTTSYIFRMIVSNGAGTLSDTVLNVRNASDALQTAAASLSATADSMYRWTPGTSADYFLEAKGTGANNGSYVLSAETEAGQTTKSAGAISVGQTVSGAIDDNADIDYYRINLVNTSSYLFKMVVSNGEGTLSDTIVRLRTSIDGLVTAAGSESSTSDFTYRWSPSTNGTYYVEAKGTDLNSGTYTLIATTEPGNTIASAGAISFGQSVNSAIDDIDDIDYFKVSLNTTTSYLFRMTVSDGAGTLSDTSLAVRDGSNALQTASGTSSSTSDFTYRWMAGTSGNYYLEAKGTGANFGTYRLSVESEAGHTTASAALLTLGTAATAAIDDNADVDYYRISLSNTASYVFRMTVSNGDGTLSDATIGAIRDASDAAQSDVGTYSPSTDYAARWSPTVSGDYYIEARGTGSNNGTYRLIAQLETGGTVLSAASMAVDETVSDSIDDPTDTDFYRITLTGNNSYVIRMVVTTGGSTLSDTDMALRDASNALIAVSGTNSSTADYSIRWTPGSDGDYFIEARGTGANAGTYQLTAALETGTLTSNYGTLAVGGSVDDRIDDNTDTDYYRISLVGGNSYVFKMLVSGGVGTLTDTSMTVRNLSDATQTAAGTDASTADYSFRWVAGSTTDYFIEAKGTGGNNGTYRLTATLDTGTLSSNYGTIALGESKDDTIDDIGDTDYYRISLSNTASYVFRMVVTGGVGTLTDTVLSVRNASDQLQTATASFAGTADFKYRWEPGTTGVYYLEAKGTGSNIGTYRIIAEQEGGSDIARAMPVAIGTRLDAEIDTNGEIDYYKISVLNNRSYQINMIVTGGVGTLGDTSLTIRDAANAAVTPTATASGTADYITRWEPGSSTDYYLDARANGAINGTYRLVVELEGGPTRAKAMPVEIGSSTEARIDGATEIDFYKVSLTNGMSYLFKMVAGGSNGTLTDSSITMQDASGTLTNSGTTITASGTSGTNPNYSFRWTSNATADFYVRAASANSATGTYMFVAELEPGTTTTNAMAIAVDSSVVGTIDDGGDQDWWAVELIEGNTYDIKMEAADSGNGTLSDAYINGIRNISNVVQTGTTQDGGTAAGLTGDAWVIGFSPTVTGTYFIQAENGGGTTTATGTYKLSVTQTNVPAPQPMQMESSVTLTGMATLDPEMAALMP